MADLDLQPLDLQPIGSVSDTGKQPTGSQTTNVVQAQPAQKLDLQPLDLQPVGSTQNGKMGNPATQTPVEQEIENRSFFDRPIIGREPVKDTEIQQIADKYNVPADTLKSLAPYYGARPEDMSFADWLKEGVGSAGQAIGLGIPQKLYKKSQGGDLESALDELQELGAGRQSYGSMASELVAGVGGVGKGLAGHVATGAIVGAAQSKKGQEAQGVAFGGAVGGAAGLVMDKLLSREGGRAASEFEPEVKYLKANEAQIDDGAEKLLADRADTNDSIQKLILDKPDEIKFSQPEAEKLIKEQIPQERLEELIGPDAAGRSILEERAAQEGESVEQLLAREVAEKKVKDLASEVSGGSPGTLDKAYSAIQEFEDRQGGQQAVQDAYKNMITRDAAMEYIDNNSIRASKASGISKLAQVTGNTFSDAQYVLRAADEKAGTSAEAIHQDLNAAYNKFTVTKDAAQRTVDDIYNQAEKLGVNNEITNSDRIYRALDTGNVAGLSQAEQQIASRFESYFDNVRVKANTLEGEGVTPLSIPKLENYVPHLMIPPSEASVAFSEKAQAVLAEAAEKFQKQYNDLASLTPKEFNILKDSSPNMQELVKGLELFDNHEIKNPRDLMSRYQNIIGSTSGYPKMETLAGSSLARTGEIPDFLLEKNLYKLADRWAQNTFRHVYMRDGLDKLRGVSKVWDRAGMDIESKYLNRLIGDVVSVRPWSYGKLAVETSVAYQKFTNQLIDRLGGPDSNPGRVAGLVLKSLPAMTQAAMRQIYANRLGYSLRAIEMHFIQPFTKYAPELGGAYGYKAVTKGFLKTYADMSMGRLGQMEDRVLGAGLVPAEFTAKARQALAEGIQQSSLYKMPAKVINTVADAGLYIFRKLDHVNRAVVQNISDQISYDILKGDQGAFNTVKRMPTSIQQALLDPIHQGNGEEISRVIAQHLNATGQFNYNRASMSEFGRVAGPFLSTFSKWPTAISGDILSEYRNKGLVGGSLRTLEKYILPWAGMYAAGYFLHGSPDQMSDRQKLLFGGGGGISSFAPVGEMHAVATGRYFSPPLIDAIWNSTIVPALKGDDTKTANGVASMVQNFAPGAGVTRFLTDDLVTMATGQRPEGNFLERTQEGIEKASR